ncbi:hypothetical protein B0H63DRAFT_185670 [Podospora didyma]|uniref:Calcium uniporter protein n=1 Tax=Podospora didyma TaxID=330526 RepID=A0AAE0TZU7_9PEZI|nr:hypothetical protein B0H63DRAFT_185670 [Podospora didyma]
MNCVIRRLPRQLPRTAPSGAAPCWRFTLQRTFSPTNHPRISNFQSRHISTPQAQREEDASDAKARKLSQKSLDEEEQEVRVRQNQVKRPWHRQDADKPPVSEDESQPEPLSKGKLLTTPTRLLKLILPLPISIEKDKDNNSHEYGRSIASSDSIQPLALLVHPQQPLSYVERLIQAEIPPVLENGKEKIPNIYFRAEDTARDPEKAKSKDEEGKKASSRSTKGTHVASYSGLGHEGPERAGSEKNWVRWSSSTEMGDFIRDAAQGREFAIEIEGHHIEMRVSVPSFSDRTYYMHLRLRKMSREIENLSRIKQECDELAHKGAHRLAQGGFGLLTAWWGVVYYCSFHTEAGWDLVEPVTYLAGLTTIMGGYLWFLYIRRDLSYKAAMSVTVSRRQNALYEARGFDIQRWEQLVADANALRREIKIIAAEYDVDWDEAKDVGEDVKDVLDEESAKKGAKSSESEKERDEKLRDEREQKKREKDTSSETKKAD